MKTTTDGAGKEIKLSYDNGSTSGCSSCSGGYGKVNRITYPTFSKEFKYDKYTYDEANRLTGVQIPNVGYITYGDYDWTRPSSVVFPGGATRELTYDSLMRINSINVKDPGQNELMNYQYTYDKMNNILRKETDHGNYEYGYDDLYRLTSAGNPTLDHEAFTYDSVGNRLTSMDTIGKWMYNENNELGGYDSVAFVYDDNGNMIQKNIDGEITKYFYNTEDRLVRIEDSSDRVIAIYYYDPFGRRLWKDVNYERICFHYADVGLIGEYDSNGIEIKAYGFKPNSMWTTNPSFMKIREKYYFYQNDHLGTPQKLISFNGTVFWKGVYYSFGNTNIDPFSTIDNNLRYPGQYSDEESILYYNLNRFYNPQAGRYIRTDLVGFDGGDSNLFYYANNNPIKTFDSLGLFSNDTERLSWTLFNCGMKKKWVQILSSPPKCAKFIFGLTKIL